MIVNYLFDQKHRNPYKEILYLLYMKLAGFRLNKITAERTGDSLEGVKVNTNIDIVEIKEIKSGAFKGKEQVLEIKFTYTLSYAPEFAKIELGGLLMVGIDFKESRDVVKEWKQKQMPDDFKVNLLNLIIRKSSVRALELEDDLGVPYHMQFPSLRKPQEQENVEKEQN